MATSRKASTPRRRRTAAKKDAPKTPAAGTASTAETNPKASTPAGDPPAKSTPIPIPEAASAAAPAESEAPASESSDPKTPSSDESQRAAKLDEEDVGHSSDDDDGQDPVPSDQRVQSFHYTTVYDTPLYQVRDVESSEWNGIHRLAFSHDGCLIGTEKLASVVCGHWEASPYPAPESPEQVLGGQICNIAESERHGRWIAWSTEGHPGSWAGMTHYRVGHVADSLTPAVILGHVESGYRVESLDDARILAESFVELSERERIEKALQDDSS